MKGISLAEVRGYGGNEFGDFKISNNTSTLSGIYQHATPTLSVMCSQQSEYPCT